jgi:1-deoxy-D-xylulose-5-phosphate synthase
MTLPDRFIDHDTQAKQLIAAHLTAKDITQTALQALGIDAALPGTVRAGR